LSDLQPGMAAKVTVIIVNWNGERFLDRCLSALMAQTVRPQEIILVDNASSDGSLEIARRFPSVRLLALDQNAGFARGNNLAISEAASDSEWIALLNPDAFADSRWLEELLLSARDNPEFDVFGSRLVDAAAPEVLDGTGDVYHMSGLAWRAGHGAPVPSALKPAREIFSPCAAAALYRRSVMAKVGGFDEDYFCYVEDVDLGFRLRLTGHRCLYVPSSVVHHLGSGSTGGQHSDFAVYHGHRNLVWTYVKDMPGALFWLFLPLHLLMNLWTLLVLAMRGQGRVALRSKWDALRGLPKIWHKRQEIQHERTVSAWAIWRMLDKSVFGRH